MQTNKLSKSQKSVIAVIAVMAAVSVAVTAVLLVMQNKKTDDGKKDPAATALSAALEDTGLVSGYVTERGIRVVSAGITVEGAIEDAEVLFENADSGEDCGSVRTDENGYFEHRVPEGAYTVTVKAEGYPDAVYDTPVQVRAGETCELPETVALKSAPLYPEPTEADFERLGTEFDSDSLLNVLSQCLIFRESGETLDDTVCYADFHPEALDTKLLKRYLFVRHYSAMYRYYFGHYTVENVDGIPNCKYPEDRILWMAHNVLNMQTPFDRDVFTDGIDEYSGNAPCEYRDGCYWFVEKGFGLDFVLAKIKSREKLDNGRYRFTVEYDYNSYGEHRTVYGEGTLIAALKELDGDRFWSVYSYTCRYAYNPEYLEETAAPPETTTKPPETTTKAPETTTKAPETTTKAPETTTKAATKITEDEARALAKAYYEKTVGGPENMYYFVNESTDSPGFHVLVRRKMDGYYTTDDEIFVSEDGKTVCYYIDRPR